MYAAIISTLAFIGAASAQASAATVDIAAIEAHFTQAQLVPQLISSFVPEGTLAVSFSGTAITPGQSLSQSAVASYPSLAVAPSATNATDVSTSNQYTVIMVDADVVGTDESTSAQTRHWLVNGASLSGSAPYTISYNNATSITDYAGPGPASGSGSHRYVVLVYKQPSTFTPPANLSTAGTALSTMYLSSYVSETGLQGPIAANYFQVEVGTATATVAATTAVQTSTLATSSAAASGTASGAASGTASGTASASKTTGSTTGSASSAAATTSKAAAGRVEAGYGKGLIIGAVGIVGTLVGAAIGL